MVMTPRIGDDFVMWPSATDDRTLGIVDFLIFPHLDNPDLPWNTMANAEEWAAGLSGPAYAIDDETAFKVVDGTSRSSPRGTGNCSRPRTEKVDHQSSELIRLLFGDMMAAQRGRARPAPDVGRTTTLSPQREGCDTVA